MAATATGDERLHEIAAAARRQAAEMFAGLDADQWATPSLCAGWTVREVLAHLVPPAGGYSVVGLLRLVGTVVRYRGDLDRMVDVETRKDARCDPAELVAQLQDRADVRLTVPVLGAAGPACDALVHLRDAARPLGSSVCPPADHWRPVLDFLVSKPASRGFVPAARIAGLRLVASDPEVDGDWTHDVAPTRGRGASRGEGAGEGEGEGGEVRGSGEAVAMAVAGRAAALDDLTGSGVAVLARRLGAS